MSRLSLRTLLFWLPSSAGIGVVSTEARASNQAATALPVDTIAGVRSRYLQSEHLVRVFLPPAYHRSSQRYPVLYANDGQDMENLGLPRLLDSLYASQAIEPIIVVAIHANGDRLQEYGTSESPNAQGLGGKAGKYERFLVEELMPMIEDRYRVQAGNRNAIMGWSLGGLSAFDIAWRHSQRFNTVGVFSGSFWWRTDDSSVATRQASRVMHRVVRETPERPNLRIWLEAGRHDERDDRDGNGVIDAIQDTKELMEALGGRGFRDGADMTFVEMEGGHDPETWSQALPRFLGWAFGPPD
jgi:enterochelin esterase-like enzyme